MRLLRRVFPIALMALMLVAAMLSPVFVHDVGAEHDERLASDLSTGRRLFERETFGGNGRTCLTCHSRDTGTVSPADAQYRFTLDRKDPLFLADGSDDGQGQGVTRMLSHATVLVNVPLAPNVSVANDPSARKVTVPRGIPTTLNTPALDPVLMVDGRQPDLEAQASGAILDHARGIRLPGPRDLARLAAFERTPGFFSSARMLKLAYLGITPRLPRGRTAAEQRGRRFFEDLPPGADGKDGLCAACHSGAMLNETNDFLPAPPFRRGGRFQSVGVSEFNTAGNPVFDFVFTKADGTQTTISSPDAGRALVTGDLSPGVSVNAFKIPSLWGSSRTAPYFHDNSAATLEDVMRHYARFFEVVSGGRLILTEQDQADAVAYLRRLE